MEWHEGEEAPSDGIRDEQPVGEPSEEFVDELAEKPPSGAGQELEEPWDGSWDEPEVQRWPLDWRGLYPRERWIWFERLWADVCGLRHRYRLPVRSCWWEDSIQVEALAALAAWAARYDSGEWDDPPGKLGLLFELERFEPILRDGNEPFDPERDRSTFRRHLFALGCQPPPSEPPGGAARRPR
jgi:hypothetical protein